MALDHAFQHCLRNFPVTGITDEVGPGDVRGRIRVWDVHPDDVLRNTVYFYLGDNVVGVLKLFTVRQF